MCDVPMWVKFEKIDDVTGAQIQIYFEGATLYLDGGN